MSTSVLLGGPAEAGPPSAAAPIAPPDVGCEACVVLEPGARPLWERAARVPRANASTTKMITALVVVKRAGLHEEVVVSGAAAGIGAGGLDLQAGETVSVEELLYALLLTSSNEAAVALAEHVSGSEEAFVAEMNRLAARLGAHDSRFTTSHGLDAPGHYASAMDLARLAEALLAHPLLARMVATQEVVVETDRGERLLQNRNVLLDSYPGAVGVKTGFTSAAGNVLVAAAKREGRVVIAVVMGSADATADSAALLDYGFAALTGAVVLEGAIVADLIVDGGVVTAVAEEDLTSLAPAGDVDVTFHPAGDLSLPVSAGESVGRVDVEHAGELVGSTEAVARSDVAAPESNGLSTIISLLIAVLGPAASVLVRP